MVTPSSPDLGSLGVVEETPRSQEQGVEENVCQG